MKVGKEVCFSVKNLYDSGKRELDVFLSIEVTVEKDQSYYDLYHRVDGLVCMDGEVCIVEAIDTKRKFITLKNNEGETSKTFQISFGDFTEATGIKIY